MYMQQIYDTEEFADFKSDVQYVVASDKYQQLNQNIFHKLIPKFVFFSRCETEPLFRMILSKCPYFVSKC